MERNLPLSSCSTQKLLAECISCKHSHCMEHNIRKDFPGCDVKTTVTLMMMRMPLRRKEKLQKIWRRMKTMKATEKRKEIFPHPVLATSMLETESRIEMSMISLEMMLQDSLHLQKEQEKIKDSENSRKYFTFAKTRRMKCELQNLCGLWSG